MAKKPKKATRMLKLAAILLTITMLSMMLTPNTFAWQLKQAPLMTDWAAQVNPNNPLPEYPRPQMVRSDWLNLNGIWQFQPGSAQDAVPVGQNLSREILVPFPVESALSGIMEHHERLWYRRTFTVPSGWNGKRILIHFGAVDWESEVYINGHSLGIHKGGYDPFSYDITPYLNPTGPQELIVRVYDPTINYGQPRGKQTTHPEGIMYTPTTGIWQTVWLEPVPETSISSLKITPDIDNNRLKLTVNTKGSTSGITVTATAKDGGTTVGTVSGNPNTELYLNIPNPKLWSPDNPFLYDLIVDLKSGSTIIDSVQSYFGMRKISVSNVGGYQKLMLNNQFLFQMGTLDQGFWPDGIYTAPTDAALRYDIEITKAMGFNMIRKHIKVEPARWYYWADKLGILVWQDMPSANSYPHGGFTPPPVDRTQFELELNRMMDNLHNHPSIVMWVLFNEGQGQYDTARLTDMIKAKDPSRLVNPASGWELFDVGDVRDYHSYPSPSCPTSSTKALACGEYGGIGLRVSGHMWKPDSWGYTMVNNGNELAELYDEYATSLALFKTNNGMSAAVYTQITDVEGEINGLLTYDRKVIKADINKIRSSNQKVINKYLSVTEILPTSQNSQRTWKYTTSTPASNWYTTGFNDSGWASGQGGFGTAGTPGAIVRTTWNTSDIWLRQTFNPGNLTADDINNLAFIVHHDEDVEIYINGVLAASKTGYRTSYGFVPISQAAKNAIVPNANNVIAVHCHQSTGGQYIDVGIAKVVYSDVQPPVTSSGGFIDDFNDGNANGWTTYGGNWSVSGGQYTVGASSGAKALANGTYFYDFTFDADVSINGGDAGIVFRVTNPGIGTDAYNGYYAGLKSTGVILGKASYNWTQIASSSMTINPNTMYHLRVVASGSNIKVYVNDMVTPKINVNDTTFAAGAIGVRTFNSNAKFDNILVTLSQGRFESKNKPGYYIRHMNSRGRIDSVITPYEDCLWKVVPGLADPSCVSFESVNFPGRYLRHRDGELWMDANDGSALFKADATWRIRPGLADPNMFSFESYNYPGEYIRHYNWLLYRTTITTDLDKNDATFKMIN